MKKIGLIDYYIDEWHANHYPAWINRICGKTGQAFEVAYAWAETDKPNGLTTKSWCQKNNISLCETIESLCEKSDYIIILSPDNPEMHLKYAEKALSYKKNTYIDKTFAPNVKMAKEIYKIAENYGTKFFSTSALRYAAELDAFTQKAFSVITSGGGDSFDIYVIHQIEMIVRLMGTGAKELYVFNSSNHSVCLIKYEGGRNAVLNFSKTLPFSVDVETELNKATVYKAITSDIFENLLKNILSFFETGIVPFDKEQTLEVMAIREAVIKASKILNKWVQITI